VWKDYDALMLSAIDPHINVVYKWVSKIKQNSTWVADLVSTERTEKINVIEADTALALKAMGITVVFSKKTGRLIQLANDYSKPLSFKNGPVLVSGSAVFTGWNHFKEGDAYVIESTYTGEIGRASCRERV